MEFKRDPTNGCLIGPKGAHYDNEHQIFHYEVLNLCSCGQPEEAYNFCREALTIFDRRGFNDDPPTKGWVRAEEALMALMQAKPEAAAHVFSHLLTHLDLLEHGGTVGGSWLTDLGTQLVDLGPMTEEKMEEGSI